MFNLNEDLKIINSIDLIKNKLDKLKVLLSEFKCDLIKSKTIIYKYTLEANEYISALKNIINGKYKEADKSDINYCIGLLARFKAYIRSSGLNVVFCNDYISELSYF